MLSTCIQRKLLTCKQRKGKGLGSHLQKFLQPFEPQQIENRNLL
jgi:hypothetical protein